MGFIFPLRAILPWFNHQSIGNVFIPGEERITSLVRLPLPQELYNNKECVGFALYVSFTLPPGVWHGESYCSFRSSLITIDKNLLYELWCKCEGKFKGSHRLFVIHIPRGRFEEQLSQCSVILADFASSTPGVEVEMCGMRVVYEQDLKGLIPTITQCTIRSPLAVYNGQGLAHSFVLDGTDSFIEAFLNDNLIEAAKSSERRRSTLQEPLKDSKFISGQQMHLTIEAGTPYIPLKNKVLVVEWKRKLELLLKHFFSFSDLSIDLTLNSSETSFSRGFTGYFLQKEIPDWFPQHPSESMMSELPPNLENDVNFMGLVVCAAFSVHASKADVLKYLKSGLHPQLMFHFQFWSSDGSYGSIRDPMIHISPNNEFMWLYRRGFIWQQYVPRDILKDVLHKDTSVKVSCRTDLISSQVLGVQKCSFRILYKQDVEKLKQTIVQCFTSFFDNEDIIRAYLVEERASSTNNPPELIPFLFEIEPSASTDSSSTKLEGDQFRKSVQSFLADLFRNQGNGNDSEYGFILSPRVGAILPWFNHQTIGSEALALHLPPDLYEDKKWAGLSLYVAFTVPPGSETILCRCSLSTSAGHAEAITFTTTCPRGNFSGSRRLCFIHKPRARFPKQCNKSSYIRAFFEVLTPVVEVEMCGAHLVYEQDLIGMIRTITHCTIRSPPVFFGVGLANQPYQWQRGQPSADINMDKILNEFAARTPSTSHESSKSLVGQVIHLRIHGDTPFKKKDSVMKWKKNLELLLHCFFRFPLSLTLTLGGDVISSIGDSDPYCLCSSSIIPQKDIPKWLCGVKYPKCKLETRLCPNLENDDNWLGFVVCAAFSVHASQADVLNYLESGYYPKLTCHLQWGSERALNLKAGKETNIVLKNKFMWLYGRRFIWLRYIPHQKIKGRLNKSGRLEASFQTDSISSKVLEVQECSLRVLYKKDVEEFKQTIVQCFTSFFDNEDVIRSYIGDEDSGGHNNHADDCQGETSGKSNDLLQLVTHNEVEEHGSSLDLISFFIEIEPPALTGSSSTKITRQLRRNIESLLEQLLQGDNARHYYYGFILSPRVGAIMPWFSHQNIGSKVEVTDAPRDFYKDKKWVGFALYVAFTQSPDPDSFGLCFLQCLPAGNRVFFVFKWFPDQFSGSQRRLCFIHIPRASLPKQCNDSSILVEFNFWPPASAVVEMCGIRVVYDEDVKGLIQTITQSTIRNPPVYFSGDDKTQVTPEGMIVADITMATSLVAYSKDCIQPTRSTLSPPAVPSQKFGSVELQIHARFNQKVTIEWKRNLELLLQSFFRLHHLSIKIYLIDDTNARYMFEGSVSDSYQRSAYLFPQKEIPDWFTENSLTSTFVIPLPDDLESDKNWMGFVVCAAFSVHPHPTDVGNYKESQLTSDIKCKIRWSSDSSLSMSGRDAKIGIRPNNKFIWLFRRGFIFLQSIPCHFFKLAKMDKSYRQLEASFESGSPALAVQKCSLRILYKQDLQEYKQTLIQCFASVFDNLDDSQPYKEDDDSRHNKEPIHEEDQIDSFGTTSLSEDTQHETKTTVPVTQSETSRNSFNRFNSILFEPILYDNRSAVIFADFRGWEE